MSVYVTPHAIDQYQRRVEPKATAQEVIAYLRDADQWSFCGHGYRGARIVERDGLCAVIASNGGRRGGTPTLVTVYPKPASRLALPVIAAPYAEPVRAAPEAPVHPAHSTHYGSTLAHAVEQGLAAHDGEARRGWVWRVTIERVRG